MADVAVDGFDATGWATVRVTTSEQAPQVEAELQAQGYTTQVREIRRLT
jgi:hypothetical protein